MDMYVAMRGSGVLVGSEDEYDIPEPYGEDEDDDDDDDEDENDEENEDDYEEVGVVVCCSLIMDRYRARARLSLQDYQPQGH